MLLLFRYHHHNNHRALHTCLVHGSSNPLVLVCSALPLLAPLPHLSHDVHDDADDDDQDDDVHDHVDDHDHDECDKNAAAKQT